MANAHLEQVVLYESRDAVHPFHPPFQIGESYSGLTSGRVISFHGQRSSLETQHAYRDDEQSFLYIHCIGDGDGRRGQAQAYGENV